MLKKNKVICVVLVILILMVGWKVVSLVEYKKCLKEICGINLQTYNMISWGDCSAYNNINSIVDGGRGHCGVYATLLDYRLRELGYSSFVVDIRSFSNDAVHSVVECNVCNRTMVLDPMNAVYYEYSIQELCDDPQKSNVKVCQADSGNAFDAFTEEGFWAGVYQVKKYVSSLYSEGHCYSYGYFGSISQSVKELYINGVKYDAISVIDNNSRTNITFPAENKAEILVKINEESAGSLGIIGFDFTNLDNSLKDVHLYYKEKDLNQYILLKKYSINSNHYECYIGNVNADEYMLQGYAINSNEEIQLDEIFLLEGVRAWEE